jgi:hypothetical protein
MAPADTCSDLKIEDAPGPENELKAQLVIFVWVDVFNSAIGQVKLTANAPARSHDYLTDPASLAAMNMLELFRCEAKESCCLWPRLLLAELTTGPYSTNSESFWLVKFVDDTVYGEDKEFEEKATKKQFSGLFQQFWQEATFNLEVIQVFVAAEHAHPQLIPIAERLANYALR